MLGHIGFEQLLVRCIVGTEPHERKSEQDLLFDVSVEADITKAMQSDHLEDTIDYVSLAEICRHTSCEGKYYLVEKLAADVLRKIIDVPGVVSARIRVRKPSALPDAACAVVELEERRKK